MSSVHDILTRVGYELRDFGKSYRTKPLYRDSNNNTSLIIDKETGKWHDFSTNQTGDLKDLVKLTLNLKDEDAIKFLGDYASAVQTPTVKLDQQKTYDKNLLIKLRREFSYWESRGISARTLEIFQGGVADNGKMAHRYVFPIFNDKDEIVGFAGRDVSGKSPIKWKLLGQKSLWCYPLKWNLEEIVRTKQVIIIESIGDGLALWEAGIKNYIVAFGVEISTAVVSLLIRLDIQEIILAFNNDIDNNEVGNKAAGKAQSKLLNHFDERQVKIALPTKNDFGVMSHEEIIQWKNNLP